MLPLALMLVVAGAPWKKVADEAGVVVELKSLGAGQTLVRGRARVTHDAADIQSALLDLEGFRRWIPSLAEWKVITQSSAEAFVYARHSLPWPMDDRDYRIRYTWGRTRSGSFFLRAKSTTAKGPTPVDGVIRLRRVQSEWLVTPAGSGVADVTYTYNGELGGRLPESVELSTWKSEPPRLVQALIRELERRKGE